MGFAEPHTNKGAQISHEQLIQNDQRLLAAHTGGEVERRLAREG